LRAEVAGRSSGKESWARVAGWNCRLDQGLVKGLDQGLELQAGGKLIPATLTSVFKLEFHHQLQSVPWDTTHTDHTRHVKS